MTNAEWARLFRLLQRHDSQQPHAAYVSIGEVEDATIETVGRKRVTLRQTFDTGKEPPWGPESVDVDTVFEYAELDGVRFDVYS